MQIQWYPGHMARARRLLAGQLSRVDLVIELCDARLPFSSRNPDLVAMARGKRRLLVLNKVDLADASVTKRWMESFKLQGQQAFAFNAARGRAQEAVAEIGRVMADAIERQAARGIRKTVRAMVVGVPNVGKSTFINRLNGKPITQVGDRPGVTRANRWVRITPYLELLDTPGLLWPRLDDARAAERLAWLGTIRDEILDAEGLSVSLLEALAAVRPDALRQRFKLTGSLPEGPALLEAVCLGRGFLMAGGALDTARGAAIVLDEFRAGRLGRITLEDVREIAPCEKTPPRD